MDSLNRMMMNKLFFSINGRIGRLEYFLGKISLICLLIFSGIVFIALNTAVQSSMGGIVVFILSTVVVSGIIIYLVSNFIITVKRFHDFNQSGWLALIFVILSYFSGGIFGLFLFLFLSIIRGNYGENMYGKDPLLKEL